ncbi:Ktr system potassium uptake protein B [bacterium BMS3Bbin06]|nr:Ktr system potassium uptake protein B [bacterium BMS3Abin08]GBE33803.1 Ktr system potassium uptake protein B [bacterium BMS3Bbin06]HDO35716.1 potassium transporter [Nitrospirota bacterium]
MKTEYKSGRLSPPQLLFFGFIGVILLGTTLLMLPYSTTHGITLTDALFTSTSAVCVTGLIVKNTPNDFTLFGKIVLLLLIQVGGLGYMSMATLLALMAGRRIGISERILIKESMSIDTLEGVIRFMKAMLIFVVFSESVGALVLTLHFLKTSSPGDAVITGVFHAVSAFNNAGFSLFPDSLEGFRTDYTVNITIMLLILLGGIGFVVMNDLYRRLRKDTTRVMLHTRIAVISSLLLVVCGALLIYFSERNYLFAGPGSGTGDTIISALFASVTARTAGFNTIDYSMLQPATIFLTVMLMIIGASPGSTGGGIKTTTFAIIVLHIWSTIRGRRDTVVFKRRIPATLISRSLVILAVSVIYVMVVTLIIIDLEHTGFQNTVFEVVSAFGTVGLSTGNGGALSLSAGFSGISKVIIIITMLAGRLGPLTLFMALLRVREERVRYPEGRIMIG